MRIGIDTGGTFTDLVLPEDSGEATQLKVASTPQDPSRALVEGIRQLLEGRTGEAPRSIAHGTTVATNAMLEQRFSSLALLTTRGFRHVLEIARQSVPSGYGNSYFWVKPDRIVPLERVREVTERLNFRGEVLTPLDADDARAAARWVRETGIKAVAVCFLHSYANAAHERRMRDILVEKNPGLLVSISSEVWPEYREYERAVTTLVDAFVKPHVNGYLSRAERTLAEIAPQAPLLIMKSNGGVLSAAGVARRPISTALSGPAAGALGASWLARQAGFERVITLDTGGTSTDVCLVEGAEPQLTRGGRIGPFPVRMPMIDIVSIGTGGGSIAWIAPDGGLRVGPRSAGAVPGPMAYGGGGSEPTVTDAHVALNRLPGSLAGGVHLRREAALKGVRAIAERLDIPLERAAEGILELSAHNQANAVLQLTVKRGIDPSGDVLVAFGGAGPLQAAQIADLLGLCTVLIPRSPGNVSAFGLLAVDLKDDYVITRVQRHDDVDAAAVGRDYMSLEHTARESLSAQGVPEAHMALHRSVDMRYLGEAHEIPIPLGAGFDAASAVKRFHDAHERIYGYAYRGGDHVIEFVNWNLTGIGLIERPRIDFTPASKGSAEPEGERGGVAVYRRETLPAGFRADGPAIIDEYGSTTVVEAGFRLEVDRLGNLVLTR